MMILKNKYVLVTGSTDGLGKKLVFELAKQGANPIVHGRDEKKVAEILNMLTSKYPAVSVQAIICDLNQPKTIASAFKAITHLDVLVNNAGVWLEGDTIEATDSKIEELVHVNLLAPLLVTRTLIPTLIKAPFAQILNVSSIAGVEIPSGFFHTIYSATKFGVQAFSEAMAKEFENKNIRVMGYYPGGMETDLFKKAGLEYKVHEPWMFDPQESVEAITFMLTRDKKINVKRMDLINHMQI